MQASKISKIVSFMISPGKMTYTVALEKQEYSHVVFLGRKYVNCSCKDGKYCLLKC